ncbi:hypothetical protein [Streptomyces sp. NPDC021356]|uniref:WD40 repeat domain-containing protein n=1 Tax=Streptomyces sp. NPDC021356 TaxID=3154900 RepID=UPI0033DDAD17
MPRPDGGRPYGPVRAQEPVGEPLHHAGAVFALAFSPDGTLLATGDGDRAARLWDPATRRAVEQPTGHQGAVFALAFSPDGTLLATGAGDRAARLWMTPVAARRTAATNGGRASAAYPAPRPVPSRRHRAAPGAEMGCPAQRPRH